MTVCEPLWVFAPTIYTDATGATVIATGAAIEFIYVHVYAFAVALAKAQRTLGTTQGTKIIGGRAGGVYTSPTGVHLRLIFGVGGRAYRAALGDDALGEVIIAIAAISGDSRVVIYAGLHAGRKSRRVTRQIDATICVVRCQRQRTSR